MHGFFTAPCCPWEVFAARCNAVTRLLTFHSPVRAWKSCTISSAVLWDMMASFTFASALGTQKARPELCCLSRDIASTVRRTTIGSLGVWPDCTTSLGDQRTFPEVCWPSGAQPSKGLRSIVRSFVLWSGECCAASTSTPLPEFRSASEPPRGVVDV